MLMPNKIRPKASSTTAQKAQELFCQMIHDDHVIFEDKESAFSIFKMGIVEDFSLYTFLLYKKHTFGPGCLLT